MMSSLPMYILSRYIHLRCTYNHTSSVSWILFRFPIHSRITFFKEKANLEPSIFYKLIRWSFKARKISSTTLTTVPLLSLPFLNSDTSKVAFFQYISICLICSSLLLSYWAVVTMSSTSSLWSYNLKSKTYCKVMLRKLMLFVSTPISFIRRSQCTSLKLWFALSF